MKYLILLTLLFISSTANATTLYDWNESGNTGTTWDGWTYTSSADDYNTPGWRKDSGQFWSAGSNWQPRQCFKSDYGNSSPGVVDATDRAPSTSSGGSLKIADDGSSSTYQSCWWFMNGENFGNQGLADSTTDRMSFYFKMTGVDSGFTTMHMGTYLCWNDPDDGFNDCPKETGNSHYYHYLESKGGSWIHVLLDRHPNHIRGADGQSSQEPEDNPSDYNYFEVMNNFYFEIRSAQTNQTTLWVDEFNLYTTNQNENDISISSVWVGYWSDTDKWEIGFQDLSMNGSIGGDSQSTFEVRYSASPITNENYAAATVLEPDYNERGTTNTWYRANTWWVDAWNSFEIPDSFEAANDHIYFAIKDVSSVANGDLHDAPSSYIKTIDYYLSPPTSTPTCSDGIQNGDETGIDCGGSCSACSGVTLVTPLRSGAQITRTGTTLIRTQ